MNHHDVAQATPDDKAGLLRLAAEVEHWFGPMVNVPAFHRILDRTIDAGHALCVRSHDGLIGGLLISVAPGQLNLDWLVIGQQARRGGVGAALVATAIQRFTTPPATVDVVTFGADHPASAHGARDFYERLGFTAGDQAPRGPEGGSRQRYRLIIAPQPA